MTDYSKTKIYKIESHLGDKIYIGSTAKLYLSQRFQQHKSSYKSWKEGKTHKITSYDLFEEYGPENCQIVLIEEYSCNSKDAKNAKEAQYIRSLDCVNKVIPTRTNKEYKQDNREKILEQRKLLIKCECGCEIFNDRKASHLRSKKHLNNMKLKLEEENKDNQ